MSSRTIIDYHAPFDRGFTMFIKDPVTNNPAYAPACRAISIVMMVRVFISHIFISICSKALYD